MIWEILKAIVIIYIIMIALFAGNHRTRATTTDATPTRWGFVSFWTLLLGGGTMAAFYGAIAT